MSPFAPKCILAATDFSELSTYALRHALMWRQAYESDLTVLYVQEPPPVWADPYLGSGNLSGLVEASWAADRQHLERYVQEHVPAGMPLTQEMLAGSPPAVIEEYVKGDRIDLVVLGTHGRGGISRLLLGSVAERTLRLARHPTLLVHQPQTEEEAGAEPDAGAADLHLRQILCPVNFAASARPAFEHACSVARAFDAHLTAVLVVDPVQVAQIPENLRRLEETLQSWLPKPSEFAIQPVVRHGDAAEQVLTLARETAVDLVVIGSRHRRFVDTTVLGVTTVRVTRHAPCPVLVVPVAAIPEGS
jgi:nucleotide-binding universal stress UspA family protein